ncbi:MAG: ATP-binding protein [Acidobacteriota bacterium]|nr:ATP-binding protein [Acidobacteriota bacterium]
MSMRSLRWRLVVAMALILAVMLAAIFVFSTVVIRFEFDRYLVAQRMNDAHSAESILRRSPDRSAAMRRVYAEFGIRTIVFDAQQRLVERYPRSLDKYVIEVLPDGAVRFRSPEGDPLREQMLIKGAHVRLRDGSLAYVLPPARDDPRGAPGAFRVSVNRWLIVGLAAAALLAMVVMLTIFRSVFRPVEALTAGARALASGRMETRVPVRGNDEVAELGRAFNTMAEALERNERARRNMVSDIAHELRTPLTSVRVQLEAVQDGVLEADAKFFASLSEDTATLSHLIDDLQQLSLADAGQLRLELTDVRVAELIDRAISGLDGRALKVTREVDPELVVRADARRMVQVIRNLFVNAMAYAESTIAIRALRAGERVEIRVGDDGPGVSDEHKERIFDRFYRADPSRSRATGGAGLGLAIARQLMELHGGSIRYERPEFVITI